MATIERLLYSAELEGHEELCSCCGEAGATVDEVLSVTFGQVLPLCAACGVRGLEGQAGRAGRPKTGKFRFMQAGAPPQMAQADAV